MRRSKCEQVLLKLSTESMSKYCSNLAWTRNGSDTRVGFGFGGGGISSNMEGSHGTLALFLFCTSRRFLLAAPRPRFFIVDGGVKKAEDADGDASSICTTLAVLLDLLRTGVGGVLLGEGVAADSALLALA